MGILCIWTVILFDRLKRKKWSTSEGRPFVLGNLPFDPRVLVAFEPVKPTILANGKCPAFYNLLQRHIYLLNALVFRLLIADNGNYLKLTKSHAKDEL